MTTPWSSSRETVNKRYRRGKLFRARAGEIVTWKASYGYRRIARSTAASGS